MRPIYYAGIQRAIHADITIKLITAKYPPLFGAYTSVGQKRIPVVHIPDYPRFKNGSPPRVPEYTRN